MVQHVIRNNIKLFIKHTLHVFHVNNIYGVLWHMFPLVDTMFTSGLPGPGFLADALWVMREACIVGSSEMYLNNPVTHYSNTLGIIQLIQTL